MGAQDVLVDAAERGWVASESEAERKTILDMMKVFKDSLIANIDDDDVPGIMAATYIFRGSDMLGAGVVLILEDRALLGWMKGLLKKPTVHTVLLASITDVNLGEKAPTRRMPRQNRALFVQAVEKWEFLCSPDVPADSRLYGTIAALLQGKLKAHEMRTVDPEATEAADKD